MNWTPSQAQAIHARGGKILVSAAAGSGKTAVLVERVISRMLDDENPVDANRMLVVTFSNAAALEMRQRIMARIEKQLRENPEDQRLVRQQTLMQQARIGTIHAFCLEVIRSNFQQLGLPATMRAADEKELEILRRDCAAYVMEQFHQGEQREIFHELIELLSVGRDDSNVFRTLFTLYDFVRSHPFYLEWLDHKLALYDAQTPPEKSPWGICILAYARDALGHAERQLLNALLYMEENKAIEAAYKEAFCSDLEQVRQIRKTAENGSWDAVCEALSNCTFKRLGALRGEEHAGDKKFVTGLRKQAREILEKLRDDAFCASAEEYAEDMRALQPLVEVLFQMTKAFDKEFMSQKQGRSILDFSDMEQYALSLLVQRTDEGYTPTPLAREIADSCDEIMIDEFQDTNEAQELVFRAVSQSDENMFLVGDVKQSIYRFRQACPELFMEKKREYALYDGKHWPAKIILGQNFRSAPEVTGAVNFFFSLLMSEPLGEIDYNEEEALEAAARFPETDLPRGCALHLLDVTDCPADKDSIVLEADYVASEIARMLESGVMIAQGEETRCARPSDFCILLRTQAGKATVFQQALERRGVPVWSDANNAFLQTREIAPVLSLLRVLENPLLDIDLTAAMLSPLFSFTSDELARIRLAKRDVPLYLALCAHAQAGDRKSAQCLTQIDALRRFAAGETAQQVIRHLYEVTEYEEKVLVMPLGRLRRSNLQLLVRYAEDYHKSGYRGVCGFTSFLDRLLERGSDLKAASTMSEQADVVRIMTVHRSKGLEFPIVFLCDCAKRFNRRDLLSNTLLHSTLGFACMRRDFKLMKQYKTVPMQAIRLELERSMLSEELRVLYVAMTRAKERLFLVGTLEKAGERFAKLDGLIAENGKLHAHHVRGAQCYLDWLLMAVLHHPGCRKTLESQGIELSQRETGGHAVYENEPLSVVMPKLTGDIFEPQPQTLEKQEPPVALREQVARQLSFVYPYAAQTAIPTKMGVSEIAKERSAAQYRFSRRPVFMESGGMSAAQKGNALHKFMQFADYRHAADDLAGEMRRMAEKGYLSEAEAACIDMKRLETFFTGQLAKRIFASEKVYRELRFLAEAGEELLGKYTSLLQNAHGGKTAVQGVADCVFLENGQAVIVDYKTDHVLSAQALLERYQVQMELYHCLLAQSLGVPVKECLLYSFALGQVIEVPSSENPGDGNNML